MGAPDGTPHTYTHTPDWSHRQWCLWIGRAQSQDYKEQDFLRHGIVRAGASSLWGFVMRCQFLKAWSTDLLTQHPVGYLLNMQGAGPLPRLPEGDALENRHRILHIYPASLELLLQSLRTPAFWECGLEDDLDRGAFSPTSSRRPDPSWQLPMLCPPVSFPLTSVCVLFSTFQPDV